MQWNDRKTPPKSAGARKDRADMWFVRLAWIVAAALLVFMLHQAFSMRPEDQVPEKPAISDDGK